MKASLVQVQTLHGTNGIGEAFKSVEAAVSKYNAGRKTDKHVCELVEALPNNVKGMQFQLALYAVVARRAGATMIRLSVHGGKVAICGPKKAVDTAIASVAPARDQVMTLVSSVYSASTHGNRVGFTNGFVCGVPAGIQDSLGIKTELAYGIGFLFSLPAPGSGAAYQLGYDAGNVKSVTKAAPVKKARVVKAAPEVAVAPPEAPQIADAA